MHTHLDSNNTPIYQLKNDESEVVLNEYIGKKVHLEFQNEIFCDCGKQVKKLYQGFCYDCFQTSPSASDCIIRPELCEAHLGKGRDKEWEEKHHNVPHYVYLALSSAVKVGVTRTSQKPTRWIDQGASAALVLAEVPYRQLAGELEVGLKGLITDKTHWQKMLKNQVLPIDQLELVREEILEHIPMVFDDFIVDDFEVLEINYPVLEYPLKVKSIKFDKQQSIESTLIGIKGQYLMFGDGTVFNVRSHEGYNTIITA